MTTPPEASPVKSLAEDLEMLRQAFRQCLQAYAAGVEESLQQVQTAVLNQQKARKLSPGKMRDLRDMLTLCRTLDLKPEKGRRKDLKKVEALLEELRLLTQGW
jgi:D-arabinose 1-dehydrogenase-like Zn-dependent alcohol dehydrogenase